MKYLIFILLVFLSHSALAGGDSKLVRLESLIETTEHEYVLKYQPVLSGEIITLHLAYESQRYSTLDFLSFEKYQKAIALLKSQLASSKPTRLGSFGSGPCVKDKKNNIYRSDALDIYNEGLSDNKRLVVYVFCKYK